jgi:hypothetical protein
MKQQLNDTKAELVVANRNVEVLNTEVKTYKDKNDHNVAMVAALTYTVEQLKAYDPALVQTVKDMGLKLKNVQGVVENQTQTIRRLKMGVRDSIVYKDTFQCYNYSDRWTELSLCTNTDSVSIKTYDKLTTVINSVPKHRFLWWTWGVKGVNVNIVSENPNTRFDYVKYVELKK